jgi:hypothetical protein
MSGFSAAGSAMLYNVASPLWADLSGGYSYTVAVTNQTAADIVAGTFALEEADADAADPCIPGAFTAVQVQPECDDPPGTAAAPAVLTLSAQAPLKAHSQCQFAAPCTKQFVRVVVTGGVGAGVLAAVTRLKRR